MSHGSKFKYDISIQRTTDGKDTSMILSVWPPSHVCIFAHANQWLIPNFMISPAAINNEAKGSIQLRHITLFVYIRKQKNINMIYIYIYCHYLKHMNLYCSKHAPEPRTRTGDARATQQTHARARTSAQGTKRRARERARNQAVRARARKKPNHGRARVPHNKSWHGSWC